MQFQSEQGVINWKMHFNSPCDVVFSALSTNEGRATFWAESAPEETGIITFNILGYPPSSARILVCHRASLFKLEYFGTIAEISLDSNRSGGTDMTLRATNVPESIRTEMIAGWVSVLMSMKAAVDHGIDLRNHDTARTWNLGYADN